jgi:AcrR family transcriptional regulator
MGAHQTDESRMESEMDDPESAKPVGRGRPPKELQRHVIEHLMEAAEEALMNKTAKEIKIRDIAAKAGVNEAMINYYFGGKDGLMVAMFHEIMGDAPYSRYEDILHACVDQESIKPLVQHLGNFYYSRPGLIRMTIVEMVNDTSQVKAAYRSRYFDSTPAFVERVIQAMIDRGIYVPSHIKFATTSILSMLTSPLFSISEKFGAAGNLGSPEWIEYIARMIDLMLKSPLPAVPAEPDKPQA